MAQQLELWCQQLAVVDGTVSINEPKSQIPDGLERDLDILASRNKSRFTSTKIEQLKKMIHAFIEQNGLQYISVCTKICEPLVLLDASETVLYNLLDSILHKFLSFYVADLTLKCIDPEEMRNASYSACLAILTRLLLLYHDPFLCRHFDQHRVENDSFLHYWKESMFVGPFGNQLVSHLWSLLYSIQDTSLPIFLIIAIFMRERDQFLQIEDTDTLSHAIASVDLSALLPDEVQILVQKAQALQKHTPRSVSIQLRNLSNSTYEIAALRTLHTDLLTYVVLPVDIIDLVDAFKIHVPGQTRVHSNGFIVLDCRAEKSFKFARLPTAVHVGPNVGYDTCKMHDMLERFQSAKGSHFSVLGTGKDFPEEQNLLKVIAMQFAMNGFPHVSIAVGGFKSCIPFIKSEEIEYVRTYEPDDAKDRTPSQPPKSSPTSAITVDTASSFLSSLKKKVNTVNTDALTANASAVGGSVKSFVKKGITAGISIWNKKDSPDATKEAERTTEGGTADNTHFSLGDDALDDDAIDFVSFDKTTHAPEMHEDDTFFNVPTPKPVAITEATVESAALPPAPLVVIPTEIAGPSPSIGPVTPVPTAPASNIPKAAIIDDDDDVFGEMISVSSPSPASPPTNVPGPQNPISVTSAKPSIGTKTGPTATQVPPSGAKAEAAIAKPAPTPKVTESVAAVIAADDELDELFAAAGVSTTHSTSAPKGNLPKATVDDDFDEMLGF